MNLLTASAFDQYRCLYGTCPDARYLASKVDYAL
jgi:hypothetical protein